jgi:acylphosphatase
VSGLTRPTRKRLVITGRVQGVWFRESCREQAVAAGVSGWVRNRMDGAVEAVLEGPAAAVDRVVQWCHTGPARARVDRVDAQIEEPIGESGFHVR